MCICMGFDTKLCCDVAAALQWLANASTASEMLRGPGKVSNRNKEDESNALSSARPAAETLQAWHGSLHFGNGLKSTRRQSFCQTKKLGLLQNQHERLDKEGGRLKGCGGCTLALIADFQEAI